MTLDKIRLEVEAAYSDCNNNSNESRNLNYFCESAVNPKQAVKIMESALGNGSYNSFHPSLLLGFPSDSKIHIAREGSVCIYVENNINVMIKHVEDFGMNYSHGKFENLSRYWWD